MGVEYKERPGIIYCITNMHNGLRYVGKTTRELMHRWNDHCKSTGNNYLHCAIRKHGAENFVIEILAKAKTREKTNRLEQDYIKRLGTRHPAGYNLTAGGDGGGTDHPLIRQKIRKGLAQKETKEHLSRIRKKLWRSQKYREMIRRVRGSEECRRRIAQATIKAWRNENWRKRVTALIRKRRRTIKARQASSLFAKALWRNPDYREKMRKAQNSEEYRETMSRASYKRWESI